MTQVNFIHSLNIIMKYTYKIAGMTCNGCKLSVEKNLNIIDGIEDVLVDIEHSEVTISSLQPISISELKKTLPKKFSISEKEKQNELVLNKTNNVNAKTEFQQLKPLFLIFSYLIVASVLLHYKNWSWSRFMLDFMGLFYIVFSFFKLLDLKGFSKSFSMYDPLAIKVPSYGNIYPFIEVILGLLFLLRIQIPLALIITLTVLGITTIGVIKSLIDKETIECACLGSVLKLPMTKATFIENAIMISMAILMLVSIYSL